MSEKPSLSIMHPWHGPILTQDNYESLCCYIEITPQDSVKFELDKATGLLKVDRPQKFSNFCPCLYGLLPRTYCGELSGKYSGEQSLKADIRGDDDPLDVCVLTEKISRTAISCFKHVLLVVCALLTPEKPTIRLSLFLKTI